MGCGKKVREGHYPSVVPFGYYNDMRTKTVAVNKKAAELVRQCFELYARGDKTCGDKAGFFANGMATKGRRKTKNGPKTTGGKRWHETKVKHMLENIFYYGHFRYAGEVYEGKHTPIVDRALFDRVQAVLARGGARPKANYQPATAHNAGSLRELRLFCYWLAQGKAAEKRQPA